MGRGFAWLDTGTFDAFHKASAFVQTIQDRQGIKISCIEEISYHLGYIDQAQLFIWLAAIKNNEYGDYLRQIAQLN